MSLCGVNAPKGNVEEDRLAQNQVVKMSSGGLPLRVWFLQGGLAQSLFDYNDHNNYNLFVEGEI